MSSLRLDPHVIAAISAGDLISDHEFDSILPERYRVLSDAQWSSARVAHVVRSMVSDVSDDFSFIDLGSGVGKLCLLIALSTSLRVVGAERRSALCEFARSACDANAPGRVTIICADIFALDWQAYDVLYLYNPFEEHRTSRESEKLIDANILSSREAYRSYVSDCEKRLAGLREGQRVITYHGFGGVMPDAMKMIGSEKIGGGTVRMWLV